MERGRWLSKLNKAASRSLQDQGSDNTRSLGDRLEEAATSGSLGPTIEKMVEAGLECEKAAKETIDICQSTNEKREQMITFGREIQSTLESMKQGQNASILETIKDMTDGDKVQEAKGLAKGLEEAALGCVEKSVNMIDAIENAIDSLPDFIERRLESYVASKEVDDIETRGVDDLITGLDTDVSDVQKCIDSIQSLNLITAFKVGLHAFTQLTEKAEKSREMFDTVRGFAGDVQVITDAFQDMNIRVLYSKVKDMLKCLKLTDLMRKIAEGAGKLIQVLIDLFEATSQRISTLWAGLAFAKDCMQACFSNVTEARQLCSDAKEKSSLLQEKSRSVIDHLQDVGEFDRQSLNAIRELASGNEIDESIQLARTMVDLALTCDDKVIDMIKRVSEGFHNLPSILTDGIIVSDVGRKDRDLDPVNVNDDVAELEAATRDIETTNLLRVAQTGKDGFSGVLGKASLCQEMLQHVDDFANDCHENLNSFMDVWDLESATTKITEMCRLVSLGELMKQFVEEVKRLVEAMIAFLNAAMKKFSSGFTDGIIGDTIDAVKEKLNFFRD